MRNVLIASWLEQEHVDAIARVPDVRLLHEQDLLPRPRYTADHSGPAPDLSAADLARWRDLVARAEVSFDVDWDRPAELASTAPSLRWVQMTSAGIGGFLGRTGLDASGIVFTTAAGTHAVPLAEFALAGILHLVKGVPDLMSWQRAHHWACYTTGELRGRRALVVGLGSIGRETARLLDAFGVRVTGLGRTAGAAGTPGVTTLVGPADIDGAMSAADLVVLACPLTDATRGLLSAERIGALPPGAIVVNLARGPVLDETALAAAVRGGHLGGAVLDVFDTEPLPADSPLWDLATVLVSPHSASTVRGENARLTELFCDNLSRDAHGRPLRNVYDAARGY